MAVDYISQLPFNDANKPVFYYFLENWGTSVVIDDLEGGFLQFACIVESSIWHWGGQGTVTAEFVKGEAEAYFRDRMEGTSFTSGEFTRNSVCNFYCTGGNPELCPISSGVNNQWPQSIWSDPQSVRYDSVPLSEVIKDPLSKKTIQTAIYSYYSEQVLQWTSYSSSCSTCLPALDSFVVVSNANYNQQTTVKAGTCNTAIRLTASGSCYFVQYDNGAPIGGGNGQCIYTDTSMWGDAAVYAISNPTFEWIVTSVNIDHTFVSSPCNYPDLRCNYWYGRYSVFCL